MMFKVFLLMILCHVLDDFVLQKATLCDLKQKKWWEREVGTKEHGMPLMYKNDYKMALFIHALSWSIMVNLPWFLFVSGLTIGLSILLNCIIHYIVDDLKANKKKINLIEDQLIHFVQISLTWIILGNLV